MTHRIVRLALQSCQYNSTSNKSLVNGGAGLRKRHLAMVGESRGRDWRWGEICAPRKFHGGVVRLPALNTSTVDSYLGR